MYIKEIELCNFRIYKGDNTIDLTPQDGKNITIVSGNNGFGKTTFLMSLVWCLYGRQMEKVDDLYKREIWEKGGYGKFIGNSLNNFAQAEGESNFSVTVTFTDVKIPDITCNEIKVVRSFNTETGAGDTLSILIDGHPNQITDDLTTHNQDGSEIFIREFILPLEIAKFFFFDAEKMVSLASATSKEQRAALGIAYSEVLGIHKYEALKDQLERLQDDYKKESAKPKDKKDFVDVEAELDKIDIELEDIQEKIDNITQERVEKKSESDKIQRTLIKEGNHISVEELDALKQEEQELMQTVENLKSQIKDYYEIIPFGLTGEHLLGMSEQLTNEKTSKESKNRKSSAEEKTRVFLNDLNDQYQDSKISTDFTVRRFYEDTIQELILKHFFDGETQLPPNFEILHDFSNQQSNELNQLIDRLRYSFKEEFNKISQNYAQARSDIQSIQRKLRKAEKDAEDSYITGLKQKKRDLDIVINNAEMTLASLNQEVGELEARKKTAKQRQTELRKKMEVSKKNQAANQIIEDEIEALKLFIIEFKEQKKTSLEKRIKEGLNALMHKGEFVSRVDVDISVSGEDVEISLYTNVGKKEQKIDRGSLSMGERQMYSTALLSALVEESDIDFPVFIDSPMQKFDQAHARNIIQYFYPEVSDQVILFPLLLKEMTEDEYKQLLPNVSKSYLIHNTPQKGSSFLEVVPNNLFSKYNDLYVASN